MTWSKNRDLEIFWPLKFFPFDCDINEARLLTFGYNANFRPGSGKSKMSVLDFVKDLLFAPSTRPMRQICLGKTFTSEMYAALLNMQI